MANSQFYRQGLICTAETGDPSNNWSGDSIREAMIHCMTIDSDYKCSHNGNGELHGSNSTLGRIIGITLGIKE